MFHVTVGLRCEVCHVRTVLDQTGFLFPATAEQIGRHTEGHIKLPDGWRERVSNRVIEHVCSRCVDDYTDPFAMLDARLAAEVQFARQRAPLPPG